MNQEEFWRTSEDKSLEVVKKALPAELLSKFDAFLIEAKERTPKAETGLADAKGFVVDSEAAMQIADASQDRLKKEAKAFGDERLELTRPIDDFKNTFVVAEKAVTGLLAEAVTTYQGKISDYRRQKRLEEEKRRRDAERLIAEQNARREAEAKRLEEKAAKLKTEQAKQRALAEAENIRTVAAMTPASVPVAAAPQTVASNVAQIWEVKSVNDCSAYLRWLADHPEWHCVLDFKTGEHNRLAKQFKDVVPVPGLTIGPKDSFRSKPR